MKRLLLMIGVVVRRMKGRWGVVTPASLFAAGAVCWCFAIVYRMFFFGNSALDIQAHDTYFVVSYSYLAMGLATCFGLVACLYHWLPVITRRRLNAPLGYLHFCLTFIGVYLIYWPARYYQPEVRPQRYMDYSHWDAVDLNGHNHFLMIVLSGLLVAQGLFVFNLAYSLARGKKKR